MKPYSTDLNHAELNEYGQSIAKATLLIDLAKYRESCDTLWSHRKNLYFIEYKNPDHCKGEDRLKWLTPGEIKFAYNLSVIGLSYWVVRTKEELLAVFYSQPKHLIVNPLNYKSSISKSKIMKIIFG